MVDEHIAAFVAEGVAKQGRKTRTDKGTTRTKKLTNESESDKEEEPAPRREKRKAREVDVESEGVEKPRWKKKRKSSGDDGAYIIKPSSSVQSSDLTPSYAQPRRYAWPSLHTTR